MDVEDVKLALTDAIVPNNQCNSSISGECSLCFPRHRVLPGADIMVDWLLFQPPTLLGELSNLGYHGSLTLAVSSTCCPCLLLNFGIISGVADGAMVLFKLTLMK